MKTANNDDDEFGAGFEAGGDEQFDQEDAGGQFADDRAFDEEGFVRKPRRQETTETLMAKKWPDENL